MLQTYVAKKPKTYTEEDVKRAVVLVVEGSQPTLSAAKEMGVPYETVRPLGAERSAKQDWQWWEESPVCKRRITDSCGPQ